MAEEDTHDETSSRDPAKAPTLPLDHSKIQAERRVATERLLARLKAIDATQDAQTPRAYASRYIREQEPAILRLLDAGVGTDELLSDLAMSFPSIPKIDLRHAVAQLRDRRRKQTGTTTTTPGQAHGLTPYLASSEPTGSGTRTPPIIRPPAATVRYSSESQSLEHRGSRPKHASSSDAQLDARHSYRLPGRNLVRHAPVVAQSHRGSIRAR